MDTATNQHADTLKDEPRVAAHPDGARGDRSITELLNSPSCLVKYGMTSDGCSRPETTC